MGKERKGPLFGIFPQKSKYTLEALMREYGNDVLRMAFLYVKDMHTAEDMFQEVFLKVNGKLDTFEGKSEIKTWLLRITINTCKDYLKSAYHKKVVPTDQVEENSAWEEEYEKMEKKETALAVKKAVMALPECYRDAVLCVYFQDMSMEEAAKTLKVSVGTVKSRLSRAKARLKDVLEGGGFDGGREKI